MIPLSFLNLDKDGTIGTSGWRTVSQRRIDQFAQATDDFQFIHVDPQRAALEAPFGGTIAHGFLTLSLVSTLASDVIPKTSALKSVMIIAVDKVKFMTPLPSGGRVRGVFTLKRSHQMGDDRVLLNVAARVEIDGSAKPALTCEVTWIAQIAAGDCVAADRPQAAVIDAPLSLSA